MKFERQERCPRGDAWELARKIFKLREEDIGTFCSSSMKRKKPHSFRPPMSGFCRPHPQQSRRKESLWWILDQACTRSAGKTLTLPNCKPCRVSKSPTTVVTANGEVLTKKEATVHVREVDLFVTVMLLEGTPAVLSFGKLCKVHGYKYHWTSGRKPHLIKYGRKINCNTANYVPFVVPGLATSSSTSSSPTSFSSSSQDTVISTKSPASTRSESTSEGVQGTLSRGPAETQIHQND